MDFKDRVIEKLREERDDLLKTQQEIIRKVEKETGKVINVRVKPPKREGNKSDAKQNEGKQSETKRKE